MWTTPRASARAVERAPVGGTLYHADGEQGVPAKGIAESVGRLLGIPTASITMREATALWGGWLAGMTAISNQTAAPRARQELAWQPEAGVGLLADIASGSYRSLLSSNM